MKKVYMQPSIEAEKVTSTEMICSSVSVTVNSDATEGEDGWSPAQAKGDKDFDFDLEFEGFGF